MGQREYLTGLDQGHTDLNNKGQHFGKLRHGCLEPVTLPEDSLGAMIRLSSRAS